MPLPAARSAVPSAAVVLPLPGPVLIRIRPRRAASGGGAESAIALVIDGSTVGKRSMAGVVWMPSQNRQGAIDLLRQYYACEFVRQRNGTERQHQGGACAGGAGPAIGRPNGQHQRLRAVVAVAAESLRQSPPTKTACPGCPAAPAQALCVWPGVPAMIE